MMAGLRKVRGTPERRRARIRAASSRLDAGRVDARGERVAALDAVQRRANGGRGARASGGYRALLAGSGPRPLPGAAIQRVKRYNHAEKLFINDEDDFEPTGGYQRLAPHERDWKKPPWTSLPPLIHRVKEGVYDGLRENFQNVGMDDWNTPIAARGGIYTEGMSTCTTIGLRGGYKGEIYSAIYHNTGTHQTPSDINRKILVPLMALFGKNGLPSLSEMTNVKFFAIGGSESSEETCVSIVQAFQMFLPKEWQRELMLFSGLTDKLTKNAMVDSAGNIVYSIG